jgi:TatD DNase family protein
MLIDTHAHINFSAYENDSDEVISKCLENNVWMINIGTNFENSKKAVEIAQKYEKGVFASIGLHPINLDTGLVKIKVDESEGSHFEKEFDYENYKKLAQSAKVVAIGEIGLDYYWKPKTKRKLELFKEKQRTVLCQQLNLARELNLPVIFHCRMAHDDLIRFLQAGFWYDRRNYLPAVIHGFVGTLEQLKEYLKMGFYIGFNGIIFKKIEGINFEELIRETPIEKILIETDCPYLTPPISINQQNRHKSAFARNEPLNVKYVVQKIAEIKNLDFEKIAEITTKNAKELFKL